MKRSVILGLAVMLVVSAQQASNETLPYCDEEEENPADNPSFVGNNGNNTSSTPVSDTIPNGAQLAAEIDKLIQELMGGAGGAALSQQSFAAATTALTIQMGEVALSMSSIQAEIKDLVGNVIPSFENLLDSRRKRALVVRTQVKAMNNKLQALVDSLDRSGYIQEQQKFLAIIDALMRVQNTVEMSILGSSSSFSMKSTETHPAAHNALLSIAQEKIYTDSIVKDIETAKAAAADDPTVLEMLHALDLIELESQTMPYSRRVSLLAKKIVALLGRLVDMFNELRVKHKNYAKESRDIWGQQIDLVQQQADDVTTSLEYVMEQAHYYLTRYQYYRSRVKSLVKEQRGLLDRYNLLRVRMRRLGKDFNETSSIRLSQMKKLTELSHYLTYGNAQYTESAFDFACDGVIGGTARLDLCGVCGGRNETCMDCSGGVNGHLEMDVCGVCGGEGKSCEYFCDGTANSGNITDLCGTCGGTSTLCVGCDSIPRSGLVLDACGLCGGDSSECAGNDTSVAPPRTDGSLVIVKLQLNTSFTPDWTAVHGVGLRTAVAASVSASLADVQIMSIQGKDAIAVNLSISVDKSAATPTSEMLTSSVTRGHLATALTVQGIVVPGDGVSILEGPSVVLSN